MSIDATRFNEEITRIAAAIIDFDAAPVWNDSRDDLLGDVAEAFARGVSPEGRPWPPAKKPHGPLLRDTGRLYSAATGGAGSHWLALNKELSFGVSGVPYASVHQFGDTHRGIPPRPYIGVSDGVADEIAERLANAGENAIWP